MLPHRIIQLSAARHLDYTNPYFSSQYTGATNAGLIRGSYHFAHPDSSSGATQANYFLAHGGEYSFNTYQTQLICDGYRWLER